MRPAHVRWSHFWFSVCVSAAGICCAAFLLDAALKGLGVGLSIKDELIMTGLFGCLMSAPLAFVILRLGIVSLSQYLLAALAVFPPTAMGLAMATPLLGLEISPPDGYPWASTDERLAFDMSVRLIRAGVLAPVYMFTFWAIYQRWLGSRAVT